MTNPTMVKFGYPETRIAETAHWTVLLRPEQPTLGSLVLACKEEAHAFGAVSPAAFADLGRVVPRIERMLKDFVAFEKINYLILMMVDPDVHCHVIPRYETARDFAGTAFADTGWPGQPVLGGGVALSGADVRAIRARLASLWEAAEG